ncbi:hypothetical protein ACYSNR_12760 [Enterococcus sp. LJL128]
MPKRLASSNKPGFTEIAPQIFAKFRLIAKEVVSISPFIRI